jgi:hypothetical protein
MSSRVRTTERGGVGSTEFERQSTKEDGHMRLIAKLFGGLAFAGVITGLVVTGPLGCGSVGTSEPDPAEATAAAPVRRAAARRAALESVMSGDVAIKVARSNESITQYDTDIAVQGGRLHVRLGLQTDRDLDGTPVVLHAGALKEISVQKDGAPAQLTSAEALDLLARKQTPVTGRTTATLANGKEIAAEATLVFQPTPRGKVSTFEDVPPEVDCGGTCVGSCGASCSASCGALCGSTPDCEVVRVVATGCPTTTRSCDAFFSLDENLFAAIEAQRPSPIVCVGGAITITPENCGIQPQDKCCCLTGSEVFNCCPKL